MRIQHTKRLLVSFISALVFTLAGCQDVLTGPKENGNSPQNGEVLIQIDQGGARTLAPDTAELGITSYTLTFAGPAGASHEAVSINASETSATVSLAAGQWTITAQAKAGDAVKAEGSWTGAVSGSGVTAAITLLPKSGSGAGTLRYTITFPALGGGSKSLALYTVTSSGETPAGAAITDFTSGIAGTKTLDAGFYRLDLSLTNSLGKQASRTEAVHIYAGLTTTVAWTFAEADFVEVPAAPAAPSVTAGDRQLSVSWTAVEGATGYEVYWHTANNPAAIPAENKREVSGGTSAEIADLTNGAAYFVWVKAKNSAGASGLSLSASGTPAVPLTDDIIFNGPTVNGTSPINDAQTGAGTAAQTWTLNVVETPAVYFEVAKTAEQTIAVGGTDAALVTQATTGVVDGSTASATLSVFTVDASAYELMFEGGSRSFTLTVSETGKAPKTIAVTLNVTPNLTGVAVYRVTRPAGDTGITWQMTAAQAEAWARGGSLTRITGIQKYRVENLASQGAFTSENAENLIDSIAWVDQHAEENTEYLIRVQRDETIPIMLLSFLSKSGITLRLRGAGTAERIVSINPASRAGGSGPWYQNTDTSIGGTGADGTAAIEIWTPSGIAEYRTLMLEKNVTITAAGCPLTASAQGIGTSLIKTGAYGRVIMLDGSKLTGLSGTSASHYVIASTGRITADTGVSNFFMFGGSITGNSNSNVTSGPILLNRWNYTTSWFSNSTFFVLKGTASITGNHKTDDTSTPWNKLYASATVSCEVVPGVEYSLPEF